MTEESRHSDLPAGSTQRMARLLRHEVGDLLQSIYAIVAILLERMPADFNLERRLVGDLKARAEVCRLQIDAVVDLVMASQMDLTRTDLAVLVQPALADARRRFPKLQVTQEGDSSLPILADPRALPPGLTMLLIAFGQVAQNAINVKLIRSEDECTCELRRDGVPAPAEQIAWLEQPFATTQQALFGLSLALLRRVSEPHGGRITVENGSDGGVCVRLSFPALADTSVVE